MRPVAWRVYEAVPDRIEVDAFHVGAEVAIVPDQMLPVAALPERPFASRGSGGIAGRQPVSGRVCPRKGFLDEPPTRRIVEVAVGKRPQRMEVVRQSDLSFDGEGSSLLDALDGCVQNFYSRHLGEQRLAAIRHDREEIAGTRHGRPTIPHAVILAGVGSSLTLDPTYTLNRPANREQRSLPLRSTSQRERLQGVRSDSDS